MTCTPIIYESMATVSLPELYARGVNYLYDIEETIVDQLSVQAIRNMFVGRDYVTSLRIVTVVSDMSMGLIHLTYQATVNEIKYGGEPYELPNKDSNGFTILNHVNAIVGGDPTSAG